MSRSTVKHEGDYDIKGEYFIISIVLTFILLDTGIQGKIGFPHPLAILFAETIILCTN